jgi:hypothetical protein
MCSVRARPRRDVAPASAPRAPRHGPPPPRRPGPPARVPEVGRAFPRPLRASRGLGHLERFEPRGAVQPAMDRRSLPCRPARASPGASPPVRWSLGGVRPAPLKAPLSLSPANQTALSAPELPPASLRPAATSSGCGPFGSRAVLPSTLPCLYHSSPTRPPDQPSPSSLGTAAAADAVSGRRRAARRSRSAPVQHPKPDPSSP